MTAPKALKGLELLLHPVPLTTFFESYWEQQPLLIKRNDPKFYSNLFSRQEVESWFNAAAQQPAPLSQPHEAEQHCSATLLQELNDSVRVCRVVDGKKTVWEQSLRSGKQLRTVIDDKGWSVQVMHPQRRSASVHALLFDLENATGTLWGANSYITPPSSQGFKPHYDDVEVFMLQLEGRKRWRVFAGVDLAREYSPADFEESELQDALVDEWLEAGDMLYFPRGTIHYGVTCSAHASHHLTVSTYQKTSWADMIGDAVQAALTQLAADDVEFRRGLPLNWTLQFGSGVAAEHSGSAAQELFELDAAAPAAPKGKTAKVKRSSSVIAASESSSAVAAASTASQHLRPMSDGFLTSRAEVTKRMNRLLLRLMQAVDLDAAADAAAADFMALRTPPPQQQQQQPRKRARQDKITSAGGGGVRLLHPSCVRALADEDEDGHPCTLMYSCVHNSVQQHMSTDDVSQVAPPLTKEYGGLAVLRAVTRMKAVWPSYTPVAEVRAALGEDAMQELVAAGLLQREQ